MVKHYAVLKLKTPKPEGGFLEAFELGLGDLNCWGDQYFDASGYPFPDEVHAFVHDWLNLRGDFEAAIRKLDQTVRAHNVGSLGEVGDVQRSQGEATSNTTGK